MGEIMVGGQLVHRSHIQTVSDVIHTVLIYYSLIKKQ